MAGSRRLLVAVRSALYFLDWNVPGDDALRLLTTVDNGLPDNLINEGKADAEGRFWFGKHIYIRLTLYIANQLTVAAAVERNSSSKHKQFDREQTFQA